MTRKKKEKKKFRIENPFGNLKEGFEDMWEPIKDVGKTFKDIFKRESSEGFKMNEMKNAAKEQAKEICYTAYDIYKKAHSMMTW